MSQARKIRVGAGGSTFPPWRNNFYPERWPQARELEYASRQLTAIEINAHLSRHAEARELCQLAR